VSKRKNELKSKLSYYQSEVSDKATLIAVSKNFKVQDIKTVFELGQVDFGENKVQELVSKSQELSSDINWHFLGHLQSNKLNTLFKIKNLISIHSVDSISLLSKILTKKPFQKVGLFLQVNTSEESEKSGFQTLAELKEAILLINRSENKFFYFQGLMTIGKIRSDDFEASAHSCFKELLSLKESLSCEQLTSQISLSMGMSSDYKISLEYQSDFVRIGTAIFGTR
jgi:pyridoxal phosphate enzyme (YggS family)